MAKVIGVILAGGKGSRFGSNIPKQFTKLAGKQVIEYTLDIFDNKELFDEIIIVSNPNYIDKIEEILLKNYYTVPIKVIKGGIDRRESSYSALKSLEGKTSENDKILFHDAVRPFISNNIIKEVISMLDEYDAVDVAIPVTDTIIEIDEKNNTIINIPKRDNLRRGQTPQGFRYGLIKKAHEKAVKDNFFDVTDDCGLVLHYFPDKPIYVVNGDERNLKITYPLDIYIANHLIQLGKNLKISTNDNIGQLRNTVNVIFGHTSGIGKSIYNILSNVGAKVYGFSRSNGFDISKIDDVKNALERVVKKEGKVNNIIVTAGVLVKKKLEDMSFVEVEKQVRTNYLGSVYVTKESLKILEKGGHILLFGSSSYSRGRAFYSIYSSLKAALVNFTQAMAEELVYKNIKINIINPERTLTKMRLENFGLEDKSTLLDPDDVAKVAINVLTSNLTGQIIDVKVDDFK